MIIESIDIVTDNYNNRKFYFGQKPFSKVKLLLNKNSEQFRKILALATLLNGTLRNEAKAWLNDAVDSSGILETRDRAWYLEENSEIEAFLGTYSLPQSNALLIKYLIIKDYKSWVRHTKLLLDYSLEDVARFDMVFHKQQHPTGIVVDIDNLQEQIPHQIRMDLTALLRQSGFNPISGQRKSRWFIIPAEGISISSEFEKLILSSVIHQKS